jgi:hypothetical protein
MSRRTLAAAAIAIGGLLITPQVLPASAAAPGSSDASVAALADPRPPVGKAWLVGVVTDQAGHPLQGVTVEAWQADPETGEPTATEPTASDITYENVAEDDQEGYFRLEVPIHTYYLIVISRPTDDFRTFRYNSGDPIKAGLRKVRQLGTSAVSYVEAQGSKTSAKLSPSTVKVNKPAKVTVTVTCKNVDPVLGKVTAAVGGKKVTGTLKQSSNGKITLTLPKLKKAGKYPVVVSFAGDSFVKKSTAKKLTLTVKK